jgi:hypothetical protein
MRGSRYNIQSIEIIESRSAQLRRRKVRAKTNKRKGKASEMELRQTQKNGWILLVCDGRGVCCCYKDSYSRGVAAVQVISRINNASSSSSTTTSTTTTKATKMKMKKKKN